MSASALRDQVVLGRARGPAVHAMVARKGDREIPRSPLPDRGFHARMLRYPSREVVHVMIVEVGMQPELAIRLLRETT